MTQESQTIEVEVVQVDGIAPVARTVEATDDAPNPQGKPWRHWQGQVRSLDSRWWPLWVILGALALVLLLTIGLVIGFIYLILKIIGAIIRAITR